MCRECSPTIGEIWDPSATIPDGRGYVRFLVFISRECLGRSENSEISDRQGSPRHIKTRFPLKPTFHFSGKSQTIGDFGFHRHHRHHPHHLGIKYQKCRTEDVARIWHISTPFPPHPPPPPKKKKILSTATEK